MIATTRYGARSEKLVWALFPSEPLPKVMSQNSDSKSWLRRLALTQGDSGLPEFILFWIAAMTVPGAESCDVAPRDRLRVGEHQQSINTDI